METETPGFLSIDHLSKQVRSGDSQITILRDINLHIQKGDSVAIQGASGSGKTTLLTLMAGLDLPTSGDIYFNNQHLNKMNDEERAMMRGKYVGFIFQSFQLLPTLTALENVMLPLEIRHVPHHTARQLAESWLEKVGLKNRTHHYPLQLSGGEQQRVAIARAFINQPEIIFADEMTGNLDTHTGEMVLEILFNLNQKEKTTLVLVTHDAKLASRCHSHYQITEGVLQPC